MKIVLGDTTITRPILQRADIWISMKIALGATTITRPILQRADRSMKIYIWMSIKEACDRSYKEQISEYQWRKHLEIVLGDTTITSTVSKTARQQPTILIIATLYINEQWQQPKIIATVTLCRGRQRRQGGQRSKEGWRPTSCTMRRCFEKSWLVQILNIEYGLRWRLEPSIIDNEALF